MLHTLTQQALADAAAKQLADSQQQLALTPAEPEPQVVTTVATNDDALADDTPTDDTAPAQLPFSTNLGRLLSGGRAWSSLPLVPCDAGGADASLEMADKTGTLSQLSAGG